MNQEEKIPRAYFYDIFQEIVEFTQLNKYGWSPLMFALNYNK